MVAVSDPIFCILYQRGEIYVLAAKVSFDVFLNIIIIYVCVADLCTVPGSGQTYKLSVLSYFFLPPLNLQVRKKKDADWICLSHLYHSSLHIIKLEGPKMPEL